MTQKAITTGISLTKILFIGGAGIISQACSELAVRRELDLTL
jgi:hypothetical protein